MVKQTLTQQNIQKFIDAGFDEVLSKSSKYRIFYKKFYKDSKIYERYFFFGKSGAIRVNHKNCVSDSWSITGSEYIEKYLNL